ncbi:serine/threonine-protein kinase fused [Hyalella azteca]|uniref:non-specific serine/threonine protein kinase n=1 Tax=Hyalella azteca TaxID=294128 RepID=A0A8B7NDZ3_HYAAZ|nr:serine/threonine-protein kinase fused [Hyalella azteca]
MGRYKVLEAIGEGSFGKVFRGECRDTQRIVALKFIPKHLKGDSELISLRRECEIQRGLFHPNIVLMLDSFETEREVVAVSEYVPQQLCALLQANGALNEVMVRGIACNLVSALYYLHSHRIVHRDIKPQNILLTESGTAKLCDFGFSKKMEINTYVLESIKGTPLYMAPELIEQQPYDQKADLWSLGCILFELLTGTPPFCTNSIVHLIEMVRTKPVQWPTGCSRNCVDFLQGLLQKDQDKRLEWPDVLQHPWVSTGITVVPHNPRIASLTSPLTQSQQQVKEHQKQQLVLRNMGQPNLLPKALSRKYFSEAQVVPDLEAMKLDAPKDNTTGVACQSRVKESIFGEKLSSSLNNLPKISSPEVLQDTTENKQTLTWFPHGSATSNASAQREIECMSGTEIKQSEGKDYNSAENIQCTADRKSSGTSRRDSRVSSELLDDKTENLSVAPTVTQSMKKTETLGLAAIESDIQEEEWIHFLHQTIADVMGGNFDVYTQPGELAMFVSPLRNSTCPLQVAEKIAIFFMLPFVLKPDEDVLSEICNGYLQHKVVCNLIYACKQVKKESPASTVSDDLEKEQIEAINQMLLVVCHLVHLDQPLSTRFLNQLCEAICVLECQTILGQCLLCSAASSQLLASILAIMTQILRSDDPSPGVELDGIVRSIIAAAAPVSATEQNSEETALRFLLMSLLTHTAALVRSRCSTLLAHLTSRCSALVSRSLAGQHKVLCDLINLENDPNRSVCKAASFALTRLQQHTTLLKQPA